LADAAQRSKPLLGRLGHRRRSNVSERAALPARGTKRPDESPRSARRTIGYAVQLAGGRWYVTSPPRSVWTSLHLAGRPARPGWRRTWLASDGRPSVRTGSVLEKQQLVADRAGDAGRHKGECWRVPPVAIAVRPSHQAMTGAADREGLRAVIHGHDSNARSRAIRVPQRANPIFAIGVRQAAPWLRCGSFRREEVDFKADRRGLTGGGGLEIGTGIRRLGPTASSTPNLVEDGTEVTTWMPAIRAVERPFPPSSPPWAHARRQSGRSCWNPRPHDHIGLRSAAGSSAAGRQRPRAGRGAARGEVPTRPQGGGPMRPLSFARVPVVVFAARCPDQGTSGAVSTLPATARRLDVPRFAPSHARVPGHFIARQPGPTLRPAMRAARRPMRCAPTRTTGRSGPQIAPFSADPQRR